MAMGLCAHACASSYIAITITLLLNLKVILYLALFSYVANI